MEKKIATKKQISRWLAVSLAAVMTVTAAGCGSGSGGSSATEGTTAAAQTAQTSAETTAQAAAGTGETAGQETQAQTAGRVTYEPVFTPSGTQPEVYTEHMEGMVEELFDSFEANGEADLLKGYDEPVSVDMMNYYSAAMEKTITDYEEKYGETFSYNRWEDLFKRMFNVDISLEMRPSADYSTQLRLDMTALDIPDIFIVSQHADLIDMASEGLLADLSGVLDQYATQQVKDNLYSDGGAAIRMATYDGGLYAIPCSQSATDAVPYLWIREDWLEKLNLEEPKTLDDMETVMEAFMTQDPDGNGIADTMGIGSQSDIFTIFKGVFAAYGSYPGSWYEDENGEVVYGSVTETTKNALERLAKWYEKGYINPEYITTKASDMTAMVADGKIGLLYYGHWLGNGVLNGQHQSDPDAVWKCIPLPSLDGSPVKCVLNPYNTGFVAVSKDFEHPELAVKMLNIASYALARSNNHGYWMTYEQDGTWGFSPVRITESAFGNLNTYLTLQNFFDNNKDTSLLQGKSVSYWKNMQSEDVSYGWYLMFGPGDGTPMAMLKQIYDDGDLFWTVFNGPNTSLMDSYWTTLTDQRSVIFKSIINGEVSADEGFQQWLDFWNSMSGNDITEEVRAWCAENVN